MGADSTSDAHYVVEIEAMRRAKDEAFRSERWSPIPAPARASFEGLLYFAPDPAWRVRASVARLGRGAPIEMATSTGEPRRQERAAKLSFETPAGPASLFAYQDADGSDATSLFVPFRDSTSGSLTYGAGRYLDLDDTGADHLLVDFNLAYNPYCAYSEAYSCPLPPAENWLKIAVTAGEKAPSH